MLLSNTKLQVLDLTEAMSISSKYGRCSHTSSLQICLNCSHRNSCILHLDDCKHVQCPCNARHLQLAVTSVNTVDHLLQSQGLRQSLSIQGCCTVTLVLFIASTRPARHLGWNAALAAMQIRIITTVISNVCTQCVSSPSMPYKFIPQAKDFTSKEDPLMQKKQNRHIHTRFKSLLDDVAELLELHGIRGSAAV